MNALRTLVNNSFKESFYRKKKNNFNVLTIFFISHKSDVKIFLKLNINQYPKALVSITLE